MDNRGTDGVESVDGEELTRWWEAGAIVLRRSPRVFSRLLAVVEVTACELSSQAENYIG